MGYTHYWNNTKFTTEQWSELAKDAAKLFKECKQNGILLAAEYDRTKTPPHIGLESIVFNGVGDEGHETFVLEKTPDPNGFVFCKTLRKDYDTAVVALLIIATTHNPEFRWSSDGKSKDHADGLTIVNKINGLNNTTGCVESISE